MEALKLFDYPYDRPTSDEPLQPLKPDTVGMACPPPTGQVGQEIQASSSDEVSHEVDFTVDHSVS